MPLNIPDKLPAYDVLTGENIFVMTHSRAVHQDIRPLHIGLLNLMPLKIETEVHLLRLLSNTPLQVEIDLVHTATYRSTHTPESHLETFYTTFEEIKDKKYDGFIITGAPVEQMEFEDVAYWKELTVIMDWAKKHVTSTLYICWAAQAGLYYNYSVPKYPLDKKMFGIFSHTVTAPQVPLVRGFDDTFLAPHSRHTEIRKEDIQANPELVLVSESEEAGVFIVSTSSGRDIYVTGHVEYDPLTLKKEYLRDKNKGLEIEPPENYFPSGDETQHPVVRWRSHANLLFSNWLNYYVYQITPFHIEDIS
ncbi:homoserine O-succinyltransferase [Marispirochaeta aestuarii]|uniref:homoserine O-acetyltransferase MetA n=1 Tax=Marispirochaeta aestuarii TaxID=1963862 RepID=UPI0029C9B17B|nr:homoserine O-succinyltransferase [Marispirochaeta aestuarii]